MIRSLRRVHLPLVAGLGLGAGLVLVVATRSRPGDAVMNAIPPALLADTCPASAPSTAPLWWDGPAQLCLDPADLPGEPDLLAYWAADSAGPQLPASARFLGALARGGSAAVALSLPDPGMGTRGFLYLLSNGHQEVVLVRRIPPP